MSSAAVVIGALRVNKGTLWYGLPMILNIDKHVIPMFSIFGLKFVRKDRMGDNQKANNNSMIPILLQNINNDITSKHVNYK